MYDSQPYRTAIIRTPEMNLNYTGYACIYFFYYAYGASTMPLRVYRVNHLSSMDMLSEISAFSDHGWHPVYISLSLPFHGRIQFEAITSHTFSNADIAIDDLVVYDGACATCK